MKKLLNNAAIFAALCAVTSGCIEDARVNDNPTTGMAVEFATTISKTRARDDVWEPGDRIGVYMLAADPDADPAEADWSEATGTPPLFENMQYGHNLEAESRTVIFSGIGEENTLVWPPDGSKVDFVAYYPYRAPSMIVDHLYPVELADQSSPKNIDLMWSDNLRNVAPGNHTLSFEHKLTKLVFNITDLGGASLDGMVSTFGDLPTTARFNLATGEIKAGSEGNVDTFYAVLVDTFDSDEDGEQVNETAVVEAIVLPGEDLTYYLIFELANEEKAVFKVENTKYEAGKRYIYNIHLLARESEVVLGDTEGELESITDWTDVGSANDDPYEIPKTGENDPPVEKGAVWRSVTLSSDSVEYQVATNGSVDEQRGAFLLSGDGEVTIKKGDNTGTVSVAVSMRIAPGASAEISSVMAGKVPLVYDDGGMMASINSSNGERFVFRTRDGKPVAGDVEIVVKGISGTTVLSSFDINAE